MRVDGRGIAVGLGVAIITLILIGAASHHLHHGFEDDHEEAADVTGSPADGSVEPTTNGANGAEFINVVHEASQEPLQVGDMAEKAKEAVNKFVEMVGDNLSKVEKAIEEENIVDLVGGATADQKTTADPEQEQEPTPNFVDFPVNPKLKQQRKHNRRHKAHNLKSSSSEERNDEVVRLPQYKESFLDSIIRFFSSPSGGVPKRTSRHMVHAPAAMIRPASIKPKDRNSFKAFQQAHQDQSE